MEIQAIVAFVLAYLLGSIDFGVVLPRLGGVDIYAHGSGNPGASNVLRVMGKRWAAAVMVGDIGKGLAAVAVADLWVGEPAALAAMFAATAGHCYPIWHRFHGGKGVATAGGGLLWVEPLVGLGAVLGWALVTWRLKIASVASLGVLVLLVPVMALVGHSGWSLVWLGLTAGLVVYRHRGNIGRLLEGAEKTVESA